MKHRPRAREHKKLKFPPKTFRFCKVCNKQTKFIFDNRIGHSSCIECGNRDIKW